LKTWSKISKLTQSTQGTSEKQLIPVDICDICHIDKEDDRDWGRILWEKLKFRHHQHPIHLQDQACGKPGIRYIGRESFNSGCGLMTRMQ
jgi:hypothetical protein